MHMYGESKKQMNLVKKTCDRILRSDNKTTMKYKAYIPLRRKTTGVGYFCVT